MNQQAAAGNPGKSMHNNKLVRDVPQVVAPARRFHES